MNKWLDRQAYEDTAETTFYVKAEYQSNGIGRELNEAISAEAYRL